MKKMISVIYGYMRNMKRILSIVWVLVLVFGLCACAASNPTGTQLGSTTRPGTAPTVPTTQPIPSTVTASMGKPEEEGVYFDLSLMPEARKEEIARCWDNRNMYSDLDWEAEHNFQTRFCGDFGTCVVIWQSSGLAVEQKTVVADYVFAFSSTFDLYVYANDTFYDMEEAYRDGLLAQEQIGLVHAYYDSSKALWEQEVATRPLPDDPIPPFTKPEVPPYPFEGSFDPDALLADIPADVQRQIKQTLIDQFVPEHQNISVDRVGLEVFGIFDGVYAVRSVGVFFGMDALESETINGLRFTYSNSASVLFIYYDGHWYGLQEAMDAQIIGETELLVIYENYYKAHPYLWGY